MDAERIRSKAREYELNKLAADERGDVLAAVCFATVAIVLFELAEEFDLEEAA